MKPVEGRIFFGGGAGAATACAGREGAQRSPSGVNEGLLGCHCALGKWIEGL